MCHLPSASTDEYEIEAVHEFAYLGSTVMDSLSLDTELNKRIEKAATTLSRLDPALPEREETQQLSCALLETHPRHLVERQGDRQRGSARKSRHPDHLHASQTETHEMVGSRLLHGRQVHLEKGSEKEGSLSSKRT